MLKAINVSDDLCPRCDPDIIIEATSFRKRRNFAMEREYRATYSRSISFERQDSCVLDENNKSKDGK